VRSRVAAAKPAPRLFVIAARAARVALVLRRGPSAWYHLIAWETRGDAFTHGAWFRGRIYEDKCDLSPDGKLLVYAAHKGNRWRTSYTSSWTAVSRPPWLHALALWPMGTTYGGGGRFVDDHQLITRGTGRLHPDHPPGGLDTRKLQLVAGDAAYQRSSDEVPGADWSGRDHDDRLIYAMNGRLYRRIRRREVEVADFTDLEPVPGDPPSWAQRPL
jgi:hypothetical protein